MQTSTTVTSKGQVTIPKAVRQQLGICQGSQVEFVMVDNHVELRVINNPTPIVQSGFGLLKSQKTPIPNDFDVSILAQKP
ncbi:MAG TPA: AbrB/MazE/SpoVT family DNA-binding domain-containing protein [Agitococcus sp.]|jgi:AbrB family looped-hinge helix DNA binding protein|nr:AbrB/MazE/SpoVT family DNA-binding domain-containing protein [Agitococcus sp.]HMY29229.1 AbrB/MazE/SpoVT family DNA-binding domain-containing protein [Agitococcus sp.]HNG10917.1 AbrB/MazE/SpoVT family DNA-binding domain-containing protein [Agitococcus sp.]HNL81100.1 AbrB/MazE/SpoVT family DNA-binding domain-containing protein [Agitococcus sp.]